jgi:hypothetical protein
LYLAGLIVFNKGKVGNRNDRKHKGGSQMIRKIYRNLQMGSPSAQPRACEQDENSSAKWILTNPGSPAGFASQPECSPQIVSSFVSIVPPCCIQAN